ncbi:putative integral membrane protein [Theileria parva strain Muguga]|uniref:t-SNARE coiled-coil homology domain-containing protein n=1 Tax=Theileria parva TaxID=5875 RepID=Q4N1F0_THEPA|nr:putative integral membrane protein [Theileria parva strain Muguga]EAN32148.1 putative integral membrane protein [Theileria parva strain Muguga]|eukprot:XP_764431.1 hypothetical protein [Theileria parva strain Muguga]
MGDSVRITITGDEGIDPFAAERNLENLDFEAQRQLIVNLITSMTENVKERDKIKRDKTSHPLSHIKLSTKLESQVLAAYNYLDVLKNIYSKLVSNKKKRGKYTEHELNSFGETIKNLDENLLNLENMIRYRASAMTRKTRMDLNINSVPFDKSALTTEEQNYVTESIRRWNERDEGFDKQLQEIGEAVDRIGEVAIHIGARAQDQAKAAMEAVGDVENTTKGVSEVTSKIKRLLKRQRMVECYCRFVLVLIVLILSGVVIYLVMKRLKHK